MIRLQSPLSLVQIDRMWLLTERRIEVRAAHIDKPRSGLFLCENIIKIQGWVLGLRKRAVSASVNVNGQVLRQKRLSMVRPDVCATYPNPAENDRCGFRFRIPIKALPQRFALEVEAFFENETHEVIACIKGEHAELDGQQACESLSGFFLDAV